MAFATYSEYIEANSSEKIALALIFPRQGVTTFASQGGNIWKRTVAGVVNKLFSESTELTVQTSNAVDASNPWFYDIATSELYYYTTSTSPDDDGLIVEYVLHYSNVPINLSWDLTDDNGAQVAYESRVLKTVGFKSEIGSDQKGISVTGSGTLSLENNDGYFDSLFDSYIWENKRVEIYSFHRDLNPTDAQLQYKGFIVNKSFNLDKISFKIKDAVFKLDTKVAMNLFTASDGVGPADVGKVKRHIYGKVDGLLVRSTDQVGDGYTITGTVSGSAGSTTVTGTGTSFLTELAMNDTITINSIDYTIQEIASDTSLTISDTDGLVETASGDTCLSIPSVNNPEFNRTFFVADHAVQQSNTTVDNMSQLNRLTVVDISGFEVGDLIKINGDSHTIFSISGTQIRLAVNSTVMYSSGDTVTKEPITSVFIDGVTVSVDDITSITNSTYCEFTLDNDTEFNIAPNKLVNDANFSFTNGSRSVTYAGTTDLTSILQERDFIKSETDADNTFMRIVDIVGTTITCSTTYTGTTGSSKKITKRRPNYIGDSSNVSVNCLGKTDNGLSTGTLIETGALVAKELLIDIGLTSDIDSASFAQAALDNDMRMSISIPYDRDSTAPKVKGIINDINQTISGALSLKQDLTLAYNIMSAERLPTITKISDDDVIKWRVEGINTETYKKVFGNYRFVDYDNNKKESGSSLISSQSNRVVNYDISNKEVDREFQIYGQNDAQELAERFLFNNEQNLMELSIESDLRLNNVEIGDRVVVSFNRFINQPSTGDTPRVFFVTGIKKDSNKIQLTLNDLGNLYNRSGVISDNSAAIYSASTSDDRRFSSYITDENGIITGTDNSKGTNLIS